MKDSNDRQAYWKDKARIAYLAKEDHLRSFLRAIGSPTQLPHVGQIGLQ